MLFLLYSDDAAASQDFERPGEGTENGSKE